MKICKPIAISLAFRILNVASNKINKSKKVAWSKRKNKSILKIKQKIKMYLIKNY